MYDLIIIGAGPSGIACAIEAQKNNLNYLVIEKGLLVNSIYNFPINMTFFSTSQKLEIGGTPFISHVDKPTRKEALEYYRRVVGSWNLKVNLYEEVTGLEAISEAIYEVKTSRGTHQTAAVAVASGFYDVPRLMNVPGEDLPKVKHYYDDAHPYIGQNVLVVGAANSACDVALETYHKDANVTMVIRSAEIYQNVKYWIKPNIENRIKEGSIKAYFNSTIKEIKPNFVILNTPEGEIVLENDFVLAMTGYQPNFPFLKNLGIEINEKNQKKPTLNRETFETNLPNVYAAGVIQAGLLTSKLFIENTRHHGEVIIQSVLNRKKTLAEG
ncbi:MAG: thioredoxin reductase (NADPH) [Saprospiraceae bacterium]|jgi:thioredoxin reductase (NADPH)